MNATPDLRRDMRMKRRGYVTLVLLAAIAVVAFLSGCAPSSANKGTVKEIDLTKYEGLEIDNLVAIYPDGKEVKYESANEYWEKQQDDEMLFFEDNKYAMIVQKGIVNRVSSGNGGEPSVVLKRLDETDQVSKEYTTHVAIDSATTKELDVGDVVLVCGNIPSHAGKEAKLARNTKVVVLN